VWGTWGAANECATLVRAQQANRSDTCGSMQDAFCRWDLHNMLGACHSTGVGIVDHWSQFVAVRVKPCLTCYMANNASLATWQTMPHLLHATWQTMHSLATWQTMHSLATLANNASLATCYMANNASLATWQTMPHLLHGKQCIHLLHGKQYIHLLHGKRWGNCDFVALQSN